MKSSDELIKPEIKQTSIVLPEPPPGRVWVGIIKNGVEGSYFHTTERQYNNSYSRDKKFVLKKKETK